jgi:gamma-glutamyl:cysteine ligase YbdK (ATP-grasp superfamily)
VSGQNLVGGQDVASRKRPYRLFEVTGIELEYPVVDANLRVRNLVEALFRRLAGRPVSDVEHGAAAFSNELAAHVFEIKALKPERSLRTTEQHLVQGLRAVLRVLKKDFNARLLPTAMHPFFDPAGGQLWPRAGRPIYETYARIFPVLSHGWMNVQSCHINLPFGTEPETVLLHNAIACLLPYLPALAASSPVYGGRLGPNVCNRLAFYKSNQQRLPRIAGEVVPEFMTSYAQYKREILQPIYRDLERIPGGRRLRHEWINSRGAIVRFSRRAIEIRVLDSQECPRMDIAFAVFIRAVLKTMVQSMQQGRLPLPGRRMLIADFNNVIRRGSRAEVDALHLRPWLGLSRRAPTARQILLGLLRDCESEIPRDEKQYCPLIEHRILTGNLSERIRREVERGKARGSRPLPAIIHGVYEELAECLEQNRPWKM